MSRLPRVSGGVLQMGTTKLYSPTFRGVYEVGEFAARYPEYEGDNNDSLEQVDQEASRKIRDRSA